MDSAPSNTHGRECEDNFSCQYSVWRPFQVQTPSFPFYSSPSHNTRNKCSLDGQFCRDLYAAAVSLALYTSQHGMYPIHVYSMMFLGEQVKDFEATFKSVTMRADYAF